MKHNNEQGFSALDIILAVVAIAAIGAAVYFAVSGHKTTKVSVTKTVTVKASATPTPSPAISDTDQIIAAVKAKGSGSDPITAVTVSSIVGNNAEGQANLNQPSGFQFIAHKSGSTWTVVYEGQQDPGTAIGNQYGLPAAWFSTSYQ